jgi:hypothetical protein
MPTVLTSDDRRAVARYPRVLKARATWLDLHDLQVSIENLSLHGCYFSGGFVPPFGERVRLMVGDPQARHVIVWGSTVRSVADTQKRSAALAFAAPCPQLLEAAHVHPKRCAVLVIDADERARDAIVRALTRLGAWALGVASADDALLNAELFDLGVVVARADTQGAHALELLSTRGHPPWRIAFGARPDVAFAVSHGLADVAIDNPCDAVLLRNALARRSP